MRLITQISRLIVGLLFIFSGLIKLNDPMGFSFKLDEYFGADVLNLPFLQPIALPLAVVIVILEVLLGVALLLGMWKRLTTWLLLLMIIFFTFLTFYSAYFNKVTDCGCFGDAIPLTPWESFTKDVVLSVLILIIFLNLKYIKPIFSSTGRGALMLVSLAGCIWLGSHVLAHLPIIDFRAYAEGKSIIEGMKTAEELGLEPTRYGTIYYFENSSTSEIQKVDSDTYIKDKWWEKKDWEMLSDRTETVVLHHGYEPPVHDFNISMGEREVTDDVLNSPYIFLMLAYRIDETNRDAYEQVNKFALDAQNDGIVFLGLSASLPDDVEVMRHELQTPFPFASMDETTLKTIVRANPGVVLLKEGVVVKKWHYNDLPSYAEAKQDLF